MDTPISHTLQYLKQHLSTIEERVGIVFTQKEYLIEAFVHRSFANENRSEIQSYNERLEFLGDAVLELIVSEFLFLEFPEKPEGELSELRARIIEASACAAYLGKLDVAHFLLMGRGEIANVGRGRMSIVADLFEAIVGAIYLDQGYARAQSFFLGTFRAEMVRLIKKKLHNYKAKLQDYSQKRYKKPPEYRLVKMEGPDHDKLFHVAVYVGDQPIAQSVGNSKKEAEQKAAEEAVKKLG